MLVGTSYFYILLRHCVSPLCHVCFCFIILTELRDYTFSRYSGHYPMLRSVYHKFASYANVCSFYVLPLFICTDCADRFNRHIHLSFPPKTRKTPAAACRGLSLWVSMKFYIICVYCFSAFPCYEIFYTHINLRLPELLIQIQSVEAA